MRTHSVTDSCHPNNFTTNKMGTISDVDDSPNVKSNEISISELKPEINNCLVPNRLADHVLFWHTIQQHLANKIKTQQQVQMNHLHLISSPLAVRENLKSNSK